MAWDLALPLLIMLATGIVGGLIVYCARKIMFDPRTEDGTDSVAKGGARISQPERGSAAGARNFPI